jgi:cardiolipin synthase
MEFVRNFLLFFSMICSMVAWGFNPMDGALTGNFIKPLKDGEALYAQRSELLDQATRSIYISTFSINNDLAGDKIYKSACTKAKQGLDVRLIIDHRANKSVMDKSLGLKDCGAKVILFRPGSRFYAIHEKLFIIDGKEMIVGGSGYTKTYKIHRFSSFSIDYREENKIKRGWYDHDYYVEGKIACFMHYQFQQNFKRLAMAVADYNPDVNWYGWDNFQEIKEKYYGLNKFVGCDQDAHYKNVGESRALGVLGNPYVLKSRPILQTYKRLIEEAIKNHSVENPQTIQLYAPYFVPGDEFVKSLATAQKAGVKVTVMTNSVESTDEGSLAKILFAGMTYAIKPMLDAGVEVRLWSEASTLHRKGGKIGDVIFFGSDNLDNRGQDYQSESVIFTDDKTILKDFISDYSRDTNHTRILTNQEIKKILDSMPRIHKWAAKKFKKYF